MKDILIVKSNLKQATLVKTMLEGIQYNLVFSHDGRHALEWLSKHKPLLVISDIEIAGGSGYELCRIIKSDESTKNIPVILLTSLFHSNEVIDGLSCGADGFISKLYKKEYFISNIEKILSEKIPDESAVTASAIEIDYLGRKMLVNTSPKKVIKILLNIYQGAIHLNKELNQTQNELRLLNERLEEFVEKRTNELRVANKELAYQNNEKEKRADELIIANKELAFQNKEKEKRAEELIVANEELAYQNKEKEKRADELSIANKELAFQYKEKEKRAEDLIIANKELGFQNDEKEKRADELIIANMELGFQNKEKEKRAKELILANKELAYQNREKEKRAAELITANKKLKKNEEKILNFNAKLEERISERTAQANAANTAKSEFLANMSHEIRTPMNAVLGYADLLGLIIEDDTQLDYIESIKSSGRSLLVLINGILDLTKIEAGRLDLLLEFIDSQSFFSEFERFFSLRLSEKRLKFIVKISPELPAGIFVDEVRLHQIIINLIGNAIKFTDKGSVRLIVHAENPHTQNYSKKQTENFIDLIIEVSDTGIGISKELQHEVFNPFVQGQGQDVKKYGGTGLGLAITKRLVQLMNGTISLESRINRGSKFIIKIPDVSYLNQFEKEETVDELNPAGIIFKEAVILIVDDVDHNRHYLRDALRTTKLKIVEAKDGLEALSVAKKIVPDLIISDIRMPFMDGFQLLSKLKSDAVLKHIPVIAYSASVMKAQKDHILRHEFAGLLIKPVSVAELYSELMKNLRFTYGDIPDNVVATTELEEMKTVRDMSGLVQSLDEKLRTIYPTFQLIQPIDEVLEFGNQIIQLGKTHFCSIVSRYGEELVNATEKFNIEEILTRIKKYPDLLERLRQLK